jgi:hypothetical protein
MNTLKHRSSLGSRISKTQRQNLQTLLTDIKNSIDAPPSQTSLTQLKTDLKAAFSDRTITTEEFQTITTDVINLVASTGVTPTEARTIFYDLQNIAEASRLPRTNDTLTGTTGNDVLWGGLGSDTLTGVAVDDPGTGEIDWLIGGGGKDTFILGSNSTVFYNDGKSTTAGVNDYALIADFNIAQDKIQLLGSTSNYSLSALPTGLKLQGTGIYYKSGNQVPELIAVVAGVNLTNFNSGFTFTQS